MLFSHEFQLVGLFLVRCRLHVVQTCTNFNFFLLFHFKYGSHFAGEFLCYQVNNVNEGERSSDNSMLKGIRGQRKQNNLRYSGISLRRTHHNSDTSRRRTLMQGYRWGPGEFITSQCLYKANNYKVELL